MNTCEAIPQSISLLWETMPEDLKASFVHIKEQWEGMLQDFIGCHTPHTPQAYTFISTGACPGGWSAIIRQGSVYQELSGSVPGAPQGQMELTAITQALSTVKGKVVLTSTSRGYVRLGLIKWLPRWRKAGRLRSKGGTVKNLDLWQQLDSSKGKVQEWRFVPEGNQRCRELAQKATQ